MTDTRNASSDGSGTLAALSSAMVGLHKEQFGQGPKRARSNFAGADVLVCVLTDVLLPAELAMVQMGDQQGVRETRTYFQVATAQQFTDAVEQITGRTSGPSPAPATRTTTRSSKSSISSPCRRQCKRASRGIRSSPPRARNCPLGPP